MENTFTFSKEALDRILYMIEQNCMNDCKLAFRNGSEYREVENISVIERIIEKKDKQNGRYIELYTKANPGQRDYFHCPKCGKIVDAVVNWKFAEEEDLKSLEGGKLMDKIYYCNCGWIAKDIPNEED